MSHNVETLAYAGALPWHGLGVKLATRLCASDMLKVAGLDWTVTKEPAFTEVDGVRVEIPNVKALVRRPHGNVLAHASNDYGIIQTQRIAELAEAMAGEGVEAWEVAGSIEEGRKVFFCGKLGGCEIAGDEIDYWYTLASSFDLSLSLIGASTPIRVVCSNTLRMMLDASEAGSNPVIRIKHTKNADERIAVAIELTKRARTYFGGFTKEAQTLVSRTMSMLEAADLVEVAFPTYTNDDGQKVVPRLQETCLTLFKRMHAYGRDRRIAGTRWGFFQALTAALDHNRHVAPSAKLSRFLCGTDDSIRTRIWKRLLG